MKTRTRNALAGLALLGIACMLFASGCSTAVLGASDGKGQSKQGTPSTGAPDPNPNPSKRTVEVTLYFSDDQAMEVLPEKRTVELTEDEAQMPVEKIAVLELLKGPKDANLRKTMPPEAELLSIEVKDGVAILDFSQEFQTKHWGGSAGETMTIDSLVYTLTEIEGIDKVQVLIEGKAIESLAGHYDWSEPFSKGK
ncbi:MAG: GerMN domain-containing protein [Bacillota bacterium]|jgi:germination protein M